MKIINLKPSEIKEANYNPPSRTEQKAIKQLQGSIKEHGILIPLCLDEKHNLIDGHRRLRSAKNLRLKTVPCLIISSKIDRNKSFEIINTNQRKLSSKDMIYVYVNGGTVPKTQIKAIEELKSYIGETNLKILGQSSISTHILTQSKLVASYCLKKKDSVFIKKTILWIFKNKQSYQVRKAMEIEIRKDLLIGVIQNNKPLKQTFIA